MCPNVTYLSLLLVFYGRVGNSQSMMGFSTHAEYRAHIQHYADIRSTAVTGCKSPSRVGVGPIVRTSVCFCLAGEFCTCCDETIEQSDGTERTANWIRIVRASSTPNCRRRLQAMVCFSAVSASMDSVGRKRQCSIHPCGLYRRWSSIPENWSHTHQND